VIASGLRFTTPKPSRESRNSPADLPTTLDLRRTRFGHRATLRARPRSHKQSTAQRQPIRVRRSARRFCAVATRGGAISQPARRSTPWSRSERGGAPNRQPPHVVWHSLTEPHAPWARPWLTLLDNEIEPAIIEAVERRWSCGRRCGQAGLTTASGSISNPTALAVLPCGGPCPRRAMFLTRPHPLPDDVLINESLRLSYGQ
jgi:hypothetical protein